MQGTVNNVANFGAFVDIGVHQDGLVHISALSDKFIDDPRKVVKIGDIVKVKVMEIDIARKRVGLSMPLSDEPGENNKQGGARNSSAKTDDAKKRGSNNNSNKRGGNNQGAQRQQNNRRGGQQSPKNNMMADKLCEVLSKK